MSFSFEQLRGFVAVAEERHFGRAAARLNMTQPPLSRQVQKLERTVGAALLDRANRRVQLTPAGAAFLVEARRLLSFGDTASELARRVAAGSAGTVRLGFTAASTFRALPDLLGRISAELPDIDVELREMITREQAAALASGEIDLGLARPCFDAAVLDNVVAEREDLVVVVPVGHRLAALGRPVAAADLVDEPLIMHSPQDAAYLHQLVLSVVPVQRNVVHAVSQLVTMLALVSAGRGLAFLPASTRYLNVAGLVHLPLAPPCPAVELHLLWPRDSENPALWKVLEVLRPA
ncbi:LysR substrate-binding domain-containing protein [Nocardioides terrisoli]|uniref:LysR substrate-binding domain-containing protein n=1 Tax=Nocardioides terrisoli TaxID=3388267 RepID=UPI00287B94C6|nr:LysR substrate-binding domain-containing protein [Nocardioides marmorisolisilvae]